MVAEEKRVLRKKKINSLANDLEKMDPNDLFREVCREVESGHHVKFYSERGRVWSDISKQRDRLFNLVQAASKVYVEDLRACAKGREKFARLQIAWMGLVRSVLHEQPAVDSSAAEVRQLWESLVQTATVDSNALFWSVCRAVFNYCQRIIVAIKEGSELDEAEEELDAAEEAALAADETSLFRLGGFALYAATKAHSQPALSVLWALRMPASEKSETTLPFPIFTADYSK